MPSTAGDGRGTDARDVLAESLELVHGGGRDGMWVGVEERLDRDVAWRCCCWSLHAVAAEPPRPVRRALRH